MINSKIKYALEFSPRGFIWLQPEFGTYGSTKNFCNISNVYE